MIYEIPIRDIPHQSTVVTINGSLVTIILRTMVGRLFFSMSINGTVYVENTLCQDRVQLIDNWYKDFEGDFFFTDNYGNSPPSYKGLGSRFSLYYDDGSDDGKILPINFDEY